ncbi:ABC transporter permease [Pontibacter sp. KCTC 32443]|uniref:ABC transporter permease n=1 Tax=Pontibacter TaxID=323449 RepID=UPI00164DEC15|nr:MULTISPECIES: ABC transporter permease [Pontibacter]MBC5774034.1 ABC transporter permease [Pontibacter sp. KCTC 32443]
MLKKLLNSFALALHNIRTRLFHTLLSILGIVIGVGALVTVLSLIDGLEKFAKEQITTTTSLKAVMIETNTYKRVNDVSLQKEDYGYLNFERFEKFSEKMAIPATGYIEFKKNSEILLADSSRVGASVHGVNTLHPKTINLKAGRLFTSKELTAKAPVAFANYSFAKQVAGKDSVQTILGQTVTYHNKPVKVIGILKPTKHERPQLYLPISLFTETELKADPPGVVFEVDDVEQVQTFKKDAEQWLKTNVAKDTTDFRVITNEGRLEQAAKGFLLFRIVMGMIVGLSVVVGGIGVMNVLLISVTERTVEIGVRKAMGAKKHDILLQFLAESVTVSLFGSLLGLVLGVLFAMGAVPVIKAFADVPFQAAFTLNTLIVITIIAIVVGIVFGTYPATRAARLNPVDAIRRE